MTAQLFNKHPTEKDRVFAVTASQTRKITVTNHKFTIPTEIRKNRNFINGKVDKSSQIGS